MQKKAVFTQLSKVLHISLIVITMNTDTDSPPALKRVEGVAVKA
jgi:hypothetical protein